LWFPYRQIFSLSNRFLFLEVKKSHSAEVAARMGFRVRLRSIAQVETIALVVDLPFPDYHFLVTFCVLRRGDPA
jgi:hypothetical protein